MLPETNRILKSLRHDLHACAELSGKEFNTKKKILKFFEARNPDGITEIGDTGLIFTFRSGSNAKNILFRAEMDALPIREENDLQWQSTNREISHKCGHDGHMTIVAGIGDWCASHRLNKTDVHLLFQPAEETGQGARAMIEHPDFKINPDLCFGIHNIPGFSRNCILIKENIFTASVISLNILLTGKTAHAAEPENGINPAMAVGEIINVLDKLNHPDPESDNFFISTPVYIRMGDPAFGTSPGNAKMGFTFRCWSNEILNETQNSVRKILNQIASLFGLEIEIEWREAFYANYNHPGAVQLVRKSAEKLGLKTRELDMPLRWGEDFGYFTSRFTGTMTGIGAGEDSPALHHEDYDFPDDLIGPAVDLHVDILKQIDQ